MFNIAFTPSALDDIGWFRKREQKIIFDMIEEQLTYQPNIETRNRKKLRPNQIAERELRIDKYRVFYDVDVKANAVEIRMIGHKEGNRLFIRGEKYTL